MLVEATYSPPSVVAADNANGTSNAIAIPWSKGSVSDIAADAVPRCTAIRFTATTAAGVGEIAS